MDRQHLRLPFPLVITIVMIMTTISTIPVNTSMNTTMAVITLTRIPSLAMRILILHLPSQMHTVIRTLILHLIYPQNRIRTPILQQTTTIHIPILIPWTILTMPTLMRRQRGQPQGYTPATTPSKLKSILPRTSTSILHTLVYKPRAPFPPSRRITSSATTINSRCTTRPDTHQTFTTTAMCTTTHTKDTVTTCVACSCTSWP